MFTWEALGVLSVIAGGVLGWLLKLTSDLTTLKNKVLFLEQESDGFRGVIRKFSDFENRLVRVEEELKVVSKELLEVSKELKGVSKEFYRILAILEGRKDG